MSAQHTAGTLVGLSETQMAAALGVSIRALQRARATGTLDPCIKPLKIGQQRRYLVVLDDTVTLASIPAARAVARRAPEACIPTKEGER